LAGFDQPEPDVAFEFADPTAPAAIEEIIADRAERSAIQNAFVNEPFFPSSRHKLHLVFASFLSFFRFDFGFAQFAPPRHGRRLCTPSYCRYELLGIPSILVNCRGLLREVPAETVCDRWESDRFLPISGPKNGHFVVFCQSQIPQQAVRAFFSDFLHVYTLFGFGKLSPMPKIDTFYFEPSDTLRSRIDEFHRTQPLWEFQAEPLLSFIVAPPFFDSRSVFPSIVTHVKPWNITGGSRDEIATLAFVVYSRIRLFAPAPFGMIDIARFETAVLFFGFRYQPPYVLRRRSETVTMHVAWDVESGLSAWMDDIGSVLHVLGQATLERLVRMIWDLVDFLRSADVRLTVSVLAEGISNELYTRITREFGVLLKKTTVFTALPAAAVQVVFPDEFADDAVLIGQREQQCDGRFREPLACCFVASQNHPSYMCALYLTERTGPPEAVLIEFVRAMSHLSWLSVKPGAEKRTIAYPPHVAALLRKNSGDTLIVDRFEFLPMSEVI
jgi:hypothetical protein